MFTHGILRFIGHGFVESLVLFLKKFFFYVLFGICFFMIQSIGSSSGLMEMIVRVVDAVLTVLIALFTLRFLRSIGTSDSLGLRKFVRSVVTLLIIPLVWALWLQLVIRGIIPMFAYSYYVIWFVMLVCQFNYIVILDEDQTIAHSFQSSFDMIRPHLLPLTMIYGLSSLFLLCVVSMVGLDGPDSTSGWVKILRYGSIVWEPFAIVFTVQLYLQLKGESKRREAHNSPLSNY